MSRTRYRIIEPTAVHFLTCTVVNWLPILAKLQPKEIIVDSLRFLQDKDRLVIFAFVIMENHIHLIAQAHNLSEEIGRFKSYTARRIIDLLAADGSIGLLNELKTRKLNHHKDSTYQFWQEGSHPEQVQGRKMMIQKIEYIHNNPVRRGYVDEPIHWRYSSARNYSEMDGVLEVCTVW
jgi:putative transposase